MSDIRALTKDLVQESFTDAFRRRVGPKKDFTVDRIHELTGIDPRTIDSYREGASCPPLHKMAQFIAIFDEGFLAEVFGVIEGKSCNQDPGQIATQIISTANNLMHRMYDDGQFCHRDKAAMGPVFIDLGKTLESIGQRWTHGDNIVPVPVMGKVG